MAIGISKRVTILFAIPLLLASLLTPLLPSSTAYAAGNATDIDSDLQTSIRKYLNARWLVNCFTSNDLKKISSADVDSYNWFAGQDQDINRFEGIEGSRPLVPQIIGAYYGAGKDATRGCSGENLKNAFTYLGFPDDGRSTYCSIGSQYEGSADNCMAGGAGEWDNFVPEHDVADFVLSKIKEKNSKIFDQVESTPAGKYLVYYQSFMNTCIDSVETTPYQTGDEGGRNDYYQVPVVTKVDGKAKLEYYLGKGKDGGTPVALTALNTYDGHDGSSYKKGEYGSFNVSGVASLIGILKDGWRGVDIPDVDKDFDLQTKFGVPYGIRIQYFPIGTVVDCNEAVTKARDYAEGYKDYAQRKDDFTVADPVGEKDPGDSETSCAIDGIGWLICPVVRLIARITDASYTVVSSMLTVQPLSTDSTSDTYKAWEVMRNIANICFVIAFLIIIYSQTSGAGVSNYGVKKMLPKIVIAAILVNLSYWICAIAVDLSNILGTSIKGLVDGLNSDLLNENAQQGNSVWSQLAAVVLVAGVALFVGLSAFLPMVILAVMAVVTVLLVLTLRQGLIILLIVIAPLAFVAYLLPNTEDWFKKWMGLFKVLLLMFPIISLIFAASSLAGTIIGNSANDIENEGIKIAVQTMAAGVTIIPLFITPIVMKAAGGLLGKVGAFVNNPNRGPFDRMRKGADAYRGRRKNMMQARRLGRTSRTLSKEGGLLGEKYSRRRKVAGFIRGSGASRAVNAAEKDKYAEIGANAAKRDYIADRALGDDSFAKNIGGSAMASDIIAYAQQAKKEEKAKDIAAAAATMAGLSNDQIAHMTTSGLRTLPDGSTRALTKEEHAAAMYRIMETGSFNERKDALEYVASNKSSFSADVRNEIVQKAIARGDSNIYGAGFGNQIVEEGGSINSAATLAQAAADNAASGKVSAEHLVQNGASTKYLIDSAQGNAAALAQLKTAAAAARTQPGTASKVTGEFDREFKRL